LRLENTFSDDFDNWYNEFNRTETGKKLLDIEGISRRCLDIGQMSHSYFTKNFVDETIDANANSGESKNPNAYGAEIVKGVQKLEGMYLLHRYAVRRFGLEHANKLLSSVVKGSLYFHDSTSFGIQVPYCTSISTTQLMNEGRPYGQLRSLPPKRADSFIGQVAELCMDASQEFS
jgi:ribonucleoside-triphosphate reductase (formate)